MKITNQNSATSNNQTKRLYRIVFRGQMLDGRDPNTVATQLKNELQMSDRAVRAFLSGKKFIVRRDLSKGKAAKMRAKLRAAGLDVVANSPKSKLRKQSNPSVKNPHNTEAVQSKKQVRPELLRPEVTPPPSGKDSSRWVIAGIGLIFTCAVIWLFFSV